MVVLAAIIAGGFFFLNTSVAPQDDTVVDEVDGWQTYRNGKIGFSFQYPKEFGEVEELNYQGSGVFGFSQNDNLLFGVYTQPLGDRGVGILDFTGYENEGGKYYGTWAMKFRHEITPSNTIPIDGGVALIVNNNSFEESYYLSLVCPDENMGALINLGNDVNSGLAFVNDCTWKLVDEEYYERDSNPLPIKQFEAIISTLEVR